MTPDESLRPKPGVAWRFVLSIAAVFILILAVLQDSDEPVAYGMPISDWFLEVEPASFSSIHGEFLVTAVEPKSVKSAGYPDGISFEERAIRVIASMGDKATPFLL